MIVERPAKKKKEACMALPRDYFLRELQIFVNHSVAMKFIFVSFLQTLEKGNSAVGIGVYKQALIGLLNTRMNARMHTYTHTLIITVYCRYRNISCKYKPLKCHVVSLPEQTRNAGRELQREG